VVVLGDPHDTPGTKCLNCREPLDTTSSVGQNIKPCPGAITVCAYCHHVMAFADDLTLRPLTDEEVDGVAGDPRLLAIMWALGKYRDKKKKEKKS